MVRQYKPRPKRRDPDKRMLRAVELRAEGLSLRQVADRLGCHYTTVRNDLMRWDREHANVSPLLKKGVENVAPGATNSTLNSTPDFDSEDLNVISLTDRRKRA